MEFKKEKNRVLWGWNLAVTKCYETEMKLRWEHLSFINTHSSTSIDHMVYLIINTNQQLNVIAYLCNYAMKLCIERSGFILVSWHGIFGNCVMELCIEIGLMMPYLILSVKSPGVSWDWLCWMNAIVTLGAVDLSVHTWALLLGRDKMIRSNWKRLKSLSLSFRYMCYLN